MTQRPLKNKYKNKKSKLNNNSIKSKIWRIIKLKFRKRSFLILKRLKSTILSLLNLSKKSRRKLSQK